MASLQEMPQDLRRGLMVSVLFHFGLAALFSLIMVGSQSTPLRFAEVAFISGTPGGQIAAATAAGRSSAPSADRIDKMPEPRPVVKQQESPRPKPAVTADKVQPRPQTRTEPVKNSPVLPPKRRMLEDEQPALNRQEQGKITPGRSAETPAGIPAAGAVSGDRSGSSAASQPAASNGSGAGSAVGGSGQGSGANQGGGSGQPFTIEGDAAQRLIVKQVIPRYPEGLQQEAVLQFRFTVEPDGRLTGLIPMRKGDPTLEKITLAALRQWLFNPLPAHIEQKAAQGVITFRYQLE